MERDAMFSRTPAHLAAVLGLAALVACATNPVTGEKEISLMSEEQEIALGQQYDVEVRKQMRPLDNPEVQQYVERIGMDLAKRSHRPNLPWHFTVVDVPAVNAFALPGGYIYITRGILAYLDDEAELAGVLGHEIGHVTARHAAQQYTQATGGQLGLIALGIFVPAARPFGQLAETALSLLFLKYGRDDELQSDRLGVEYAAAGGWDPRGVPEFLNTLSRISAETDRSGIPNWLSTHPQPEDRVVRVQESVAKVTATPAAGFRTDRAQYLNVVDGIVFGDNPEDGILRGNTFMHPLMRFALEFPENWNVNNSATQVVGKAPQAEQYVILQLEQEPQGRTLEEIAVRGMQRRGLQPLQGQSTQINGLDAHVGLYRGQLQGLGEVGVRGAYIVQDRTVYLVVGLAPVQGFEAADDAFVRTIRSFRPLSRAEAEDVRPNIVDLYTVRAGDTWQSIADRAARGVVDASTLAIMNNHAVTDPPRPGERIKIVVEG
jgi:predicted Zn-dependent protease